MHAARQATLSSKNWLRGEKFAPDQLGYNTVNVAGYPSRPSSEALAWDSELLSRACCNIAGSAQLGHAPYGTVAAMCAETDRLQSACFCLHGGGAGSYSNGARAAYGDYDKYPEGRPIFLPEAERFGGPPDLPSLLLQQRVIYISMPVGRGAGACSDAQGAAVQAA